MSYSLNEVEAMSKKAARGSGLSWGMAEEAARASRWLSAFLLPGPDMLAGLIALNDQMPQSDLAPISLEAERWSARAGRMSPLLSGASITDCADQLLERGQLVLENVSYPLLLLPFIADASQAVGTVISVAWDGVHFATDGQDLSGSALPDAVSIAHVDRVVVTLPALMTPAWQRGTRGNISDQTWEELAAFAHRTYAPATDESRRLGAGGSDGD